MSRIRKAFFTRKELKDEILGVEEKQQYVFIPNEIFHDFVEAFKEDDRVKSTTHIAYAYAYHYLANYMWRYAKYYTNGKGYYQEGGYKPINEKLIKQILGFGKAEAYSYITKKDGLLVELKYIKKVTDKPCCYYYEEEMYIPPYLMEKLGDLHYSVRRQIAGKKPLKEICWDMESEYPEVYGNHKAWKVNYPMLMFNRWKDYEDYDEDSDVWEGTWDDVQNTHRIDVDIFIYCMTEKELGVEGFYLYSFLKHKCDLFGSYDCSNKRMAELTGLSLDEIKRQLKNMEQRNMITNDHKPYCLNKPEDKKTKANSYTVNTNAETFAKMESEFNTIPEQRKISAERYEIEIGWVEEYEEINEEDYEALEDGRKVSKITGEILDTVDDIDLGELPFGFNSESEKGVDVA